MKLYNVYRHEMDAVYIEIKYSTTYFFLLGLENKLLLLQIVFDEKKLTNKYLILKQISLS